MPVMPPMMVRRVNFNLPPPVAAKTSVSVIPLASMVENLPLMTRRCDPVKAA
jgi:hypothetical protein